MSVNKMVQNKIILDQVWPQYAAENIQEIT